MALIAAQGAQAGRVRHEGANARRRAVRRCNGCSHQGRCIRIIPCGYAQKRACRQLRICFLKNVLLQGFSSDNVRVSLSFERRGSLFLYYRSLGNNRATSRTVVISGNVSPSSGAFSRWPCMDGRGRASVAEAQGFMPELLRVHAGVPYPLEACMRQSHLP